VPGPEAILRPYPFRHRTRMEPTSHLTLVRAANWFVCPASASTSSGPSVSACGVGFESCWCAVASNLCGLSDLVTCRSSDSTLVTRTAYAARLSPPSSARPSQPAFRVLEPAVWRPLICPSLRPPPKLLRYGAYGRGIVSQREEKGEREERKWLSRLHRG